MEKIEHLGIDTIKKYATIVKERGNKGTNSYYL